MGCYAASLHVPRLETLLIHPPFADPTQPYLSLPTLKGWLRARGLDARVIDLNVEAAHWLFKPSSLEHVGRRIGARFVDLNRQGALSFDEAREYRALLDARPKIERAIGAHPSPPEVFQDRERFFDPTQYALARRTTEGFFAALSAAYWPFRFSFNEATHNVAPWSFDLLESYATGDSSPLRRFYEDYFPDLESWDWSEGRLPPVDLSNIGMVGISIVFPSQIPEALHLCRFLRARAPQLLLALGGPGIHQVAIHLEEELRQRLLGFVDAIALFEGERTLEVLLPLIDAWRDAPDAAARFTLLREVPNLLALDPSSGRTHIGPRWSLDLREAQMPDYGDLDLDRYWAPSRTLLYAPTRGCYWGQCSFCYYGLTETATAKYREIPPETAAAELGQLSRRYGVKNIYISCDVLSPVYATRLAQALIDKNVKIRWSSDLKIEKYFTPERCELLAQSGLRSAAFGIESGSDRILELMRKGCDRATMTRVNRAFHDAGIATEWMTFTDHPDESMDEALETLRWIDEEREHIDLFIVGQFGLEAGSHIAQEPARYGVRKIYWAEGDELRLYAHFTHRGGRRGREAQAQIDREVDRVAADWDLHPYPWAGANSTHHTFLHFVELGPRAFRTHFQRAHAALRGRLTEPPSAHIAGLREKPRYKLERIEEAETRFFADYLDVALYTTIPARRADGAVRDVAPLSIEHYKKAAAAVRPMFAGWS